MSTRGQQAASAVGVAVWALYCLAVAAFALWVIGWVLRDMWRTRRTHRTERYAAEALARCDAEADVAWQWRLRAVAQAQARAVRR